MARTKNFAEAIKSRLAADKQLAEGVDDYAFQANVADQIYNARTNAELTQTDLAERVGTRQSVIARLEDADYQGHSLSMLRRIAKALGKRLVVDFQDGLVEKSAGKPAKLKRIGAAQRK